MGVKKSKMGTIGSKMG